MPITAPVGFHAQGGVAYTQAMQRLRTSILLAFCLCWQALAHAGYSIGFEQQIGLEDAGLHFFSKAHHHTGHDGGAHQDDSKDSLKHLSEDGAFFSPALLVSVKCDVPPSLSLELPWAQDLDIPTGWLDGLDRPPKLHS